MTPVIPSPSAALRAGKSGNRRRPDRGAPLPGGWRFLAPLGMTSALGMTGALLCARPMQAQNQPAAGPPVRRIATASAVSTEQLGSITSVRELPNGRLLLNDGSRRRLLLMDTTLKTIEVVLDSLAEVEHSYGTRPGTLIPYRGDS